MTVMVIVIRIMRRRKEGENEGPRAALSPLPLCK